MRILLRDLSPVTPYKIQLRAKDDNGNSSEWSRLFDMTTVGDNIAPKTPTGVTNTVSGTAFKFTWNAVTLSSDDSPAHDLKGYRVSVTSPNDGDSRIYETTDTKMDFSFENNVAVFGTPQAAINVSVAAIDTSGNLSAFSSSVLATNPAPSAVTGVAGAPQTDAINLKWDANTTDNDLKGYEVWVSTTGVGGTYTKAYSGIGTSYVHPSTLYGTDHFFKVYSVDIFGTLSTTTATAAFRPTSAFAVDTTAPAVPTGLTSTLTTQTVNNEIIVSAATSWTAVADPDNDLAGYRIGYRSVGSSDWSYVDVDYTNTSTKIDRLQPYVNYEFRIRSYDFSANYSAWSSTFTTNSAGTNTAPAQTTGLIGVAGASTVTVLWTEATESDVKNGSGMYEVQMDTVNTFNSGNLQTIKTAATVASFRTDGLAAGNRYVRVRAVDSLGLAGTYSSTLTLNQTDIGATEAYAQSRGMNLFTNGTGLLASNKNMTSFTFDASDRPFGGGSFKTPVSTSAIAYFSDELIPVDTAKTYIQTGYVRQCIVGQVGARFYLGIAGYDVDGNAINASHHMYVANTLTTLAAPLNPGDTTVTLTSSANWHNSTNTAQKGLIFWNYTDGKGYTYPENTYSRNISSSTDMWASAGITGNVITLRVPWAGAAYASGTKVSNGASGGTYKYISASNQIAQQTWTKYTGRIGTVDYSGQNVANMFTPGVASVKFLFLCHYPTLTPGFNSQIAFAGLNFTDVDGANLLPSTMGGDVVIANTLAGDRVIANTLDANAMKANTAFIQDLSVKSTFTLGDATTDGVIKSYDYTTSGGTTGFSLAKSGLIIKTGAIEAAALRIQDSDNLEAPEYASFDFVPSFYTGKLTTSGATNTIVVGGARFGSQYLQSRATGAAAFGVSIGMNSTDYHIPLEPSTTYIVSAWMKTGSVASSVGFRIRQNVGYTASFGTTSLSASGAWQRVYGSITTDALATSGLLVIDSNTATTGAGFDVDGIQIERKIGALTTPSPWTPPGFTAVDGGIIRTGEMRSTANTTVNGVPQPAWSINMSGNAQFGDALVRGKILVGQSGADVDAAQSYIASGNYVAATTGWKLDSGGNLEANTGTFRGLLSGASFIGGDAQFPETTSGVPGYTTINGNDFNVNVDATTNLCTNPSLESLTGVAASSGTTAVLGGAVRSDFVANVDIVPFIGQKSLKVYNTTSSGYVDINIGAANASTTYTVSWHSAASRIDDAAGIANVDGDYSVMGVFRSDTSARIATGRSGNVVLVGTFQGYKNPALSTGIALIAYSDWQLRTWLTFTTPAGMPAGTVLKLRLPAPRAAGNTNETTMAVVYDAIQLEQKSYMTRYCDGDQPGCVWTGTRHASTSTRDAQKSVWFPLYGDPVFNGIVNAPVVRSNRIRVGTGAEHGSNYIERYNQSAQSFNTGVWTDIPWESNAGTLDRTASDDGTITSGFTTFIGNVAAMYSVSASYGWANNANGGRGLRIMVQSPGGTDYVQAQAGPWNISAFTSSVHLMSVATTVFLPVGWKVRIQAYQSAGGVLAGLTHTATTPCKVAMALVA